MLPKLPFWLLLTPGFLLLVFSIHRFPVFSLPSSAGRARSKDYVDGYLAAWQLPREADVLDWIRKNRQQYETKDLMNLVLNGGFGAKAKKKKQKEIQDAVEAICAQ